MLLFRILEEWCTKFKCYIILGDFNLYSCSDNINNYFEYFRVFCDSDQKNRVSNCNFRQLDLVLCGKDMADEVSVREADEALVPVDAYHPPLAVTARGRRAPLGCVHTSRFPEVLTPNKQERAEQWNFGKANFDNMYALLIAIDWTPLYSMGEPEDALEYFYTLVYRIIDDSAPTKKPKVLNGRYSYPEWYTKDIIKCIQQKAKLHKLYKSSGASDDYSAFTASRSKVKAMITEAHNHYQERMQSQLTRDPKSFWNFVKSKRGARNHRAVTKNGKSLAESECAEEFANYFHSVYGNSPANLNVEDAVRAGGASAARVSLPRLALSQVRAALAELKPKRSAGPDGIPAFIVKDCGRVLEEPLLHIFNLCLERSYFPKRWKVTRVIPIPKGGAGSEISGFRPVAILSTPAKVFESALQRSIRDQVSAQLSEAQHGFRKARSTSSNLLNAMSYLIPQVDEGVQVDAAYLDFRKAFDMVDNDILLSKMAAVGCTPKLLQFFADYMRDRQQYVEYADCKSQPYFTRTGVSQGSNLGPLEFIIMINDLPEVVKEAKCLLFADDLKLLLAIKKEEDCERLQRDIDRVVEWSQRNKLHFNVDKCVSMTFTRSKTPINHSYEVAGAHLKRVDSVRDLGVHMQSSLCFRDHVVSACKKAFRILGFVLRRAVSFSDMKAVSALYNALVRSQLECNAAIWAPHEAKYSIMMERIQNKFTRYLYWKRYGVYPFYPLMYPTLFVIGMVGYDKLETRRNLALACYLLRVLRGSICNPDILKMFKLCVPDRYTERRRQPQLLAEPTGRTNLLRKAPLSRTIHVLNLVADKTDLFYCPMWELTKTCLYVLCYVSK
jgi:hypothetical protein